jgi:hypothetical protein
VLGGFVLTYRCFILDKVSHISERLSMECNTDGEAITNAGTLLDCRPGMIAIEVWDGARLVQKIARAKI